jgi:hypothetical protein
LNVSCAAHVHGQAAQLSTISLQLLGGLGHPLAIGIAEHQTRTLAGESPGQAQTNALRSPRDGDHQACLQGMRISCHGCV